MSDQKDIQKSLPINILLGSVDDVIDSKPLQPFSGVVINFLSSVSSEILADKENRNFPDVISFAYWCRKANLKRLEEAYKYDSFRMGLGVAFHIAPSNVPVNFAFSYVFSLLAGNSNIVRIPSKDFIQVNLLLGIIKKVVSDPEFEIIQKKTVFIKYAQNDSITAHFSSLCDARIIWGGDSTVQHIKSMPISPRSIDVAFADRFSLCIIETEYLEKITSIELERLCNGFYNDTYLMDQNACSSPQIVVWKHNHNKKKADQLIDKFWTTLADIATNRYDIQPIQGMDKLTRIFRDSIDKADSMNRINLYSGSTLVKASLSELDHSNAKYKASFGYFYEYETDNLESVKHLIDKKVQTITYAGDIGSEISSMVVENGLRGVDRIVPIGSALDIDILWDGFDLIRTLSRVINIKK